MAEYHPIVALWNYRVVQSRDLTEYFVAEVYYDDEAKLGWVDDSRYPRKRA